MQARALSLPAVLPALQIGMWERITAALAELRPEALDPGSTEGGPPGEEDPEALVEYEGMLVSAAAAQRRRSEPRQSGWCGPLLKWQARMCSTVLLLQAVSGHCAALQRTACARARRCLGGGHIHAALALPLPIQTREVCLKQLSFHAGGQVTAHADGDFPCRFFSSLIQRAAKVHRRSGGGSLTMLAVLPGSPATGMAVSPASVVAQYRHLSKAQKQKLLAALEAKQQQQTAAESSSLEEGRVRTEVRCMPSWHCC